ncbi:hypothetical protein [Burkholderia territorii]|uniref:hypothetical protein n=1 Tax=Burkholderia territorii TaxID=1503055 RepID=UPI000AA27EC2|nr:hypothetical protein [Burkholderia territorii]
MTYRDENPPSFLAIGVLSCVLFGGLGAMMSFSAYGDAIGKNNPTWILGIGIAVFGMLGLPVIYWINRSGRSVYRTGINGVAGSIAISYCITNSAISPFLVMPMNDWVRIIGFLFCAIGNIWWCISFARIYKKIYVDRVLFQSLYIDAGDFYVMTPARDSRLIERRLKFNQMRPAYLLIPIMPLVSLSFVLERILEPVIGFGGFWTFAAFIAIPLSMIFNGLLVKGGLMYFYYPAKLTRSTGKPVYFARYWDAK